MSKPRWTRKRGPVPGQRWREQKRRLTRARHALELDVYGKVVTDNDGNRLPPDTRTWWERMFS